MSVVHWGEFVDNNKKDDDYIPDVTADIENSMNTFCLNELDQGDEEFMQQNVENIVLTPIDPLMMYAISLHKYAGQVSSTNNIKGENYSTPLAMPVMPDILQCHKKNNLNYVSKDFTNFTMGTEIDTPDLSTSVIKEILMKCIATMFAHIGYETSHQSALDVMSDVLEEFLQKICHHIKIAMDDENKGHLSNFPYVIERVLTELGMGGINGLRDYYQYRVVKYVSVLQNRYKKLRLAKSPSSPDENVSKIVRVKVKQENNSLEQMENAEVHFSTIGGDVSCSILETGYQLLNSLEANFQNLPEEDVRRNVKSESTVTAETTDANSYAKKKKYK